MKPVYIPGPSEPEMRAYTDEVLAELLQLPWLEVTPARKEFFMSDRPRSYAYKTYDGMRDYRSNPFSTRVEAIRLTNNLLGIGQALPVTSEYNVCFLNRYDDQRNHLGWHADDSPEMDHDHPITVVSLGAEREIWWKPKTHKGEIPPEWRQKLAHGSVFVMPAGFQRDYLHRIPKCDHAVGVRVSLTFRRYIDKEPPAADEAHLEATRKGYVPDPGSSARPHPTRPHITLRRYVELVPGSHGWPAVWVGWDAVRGRVSMYGDDDKEVTDAPQPS